MKTFPRRDHVIPVLLCVCVLGLFVIVSLLDFGVLWYIAQNLKIIADGQLVGRPVFPTNCETSGAEK